MLVLDTILNKKAIILNQGLKGFVNHITLNSLCFFARIKHFMGKVYQTDTIKFLIFHLKCGAGQVPIETQLSCKVEK